MWNRLLMFTNHCINIKLYILSGVVKYLCIYIILFIPQIAAGFRLKLNQNLELMIVINEYYWVCEKLLSHTTDSFFLSIKKQIMQVMIIAIICISDISSRLTSHFKNKQYSRCFPLFILLNVPILYCMSHESDSVGIITKLS